MASVEKIIGINSPGETNKNRNMEEDGQNEDSPAASMLKDANPESGHTLGCKDAEPEFKKTRESKMVSDRCLQWTVWFIMVLTVALLGTLLVVTVLWHIARKKDLEEREFSFCIPCDQLKGRHDDRTVLDSFARSTENENECCGTTTHMLKRLIDKSTKDRYIEDLSNNFFSSSSEECKTSDKIPENPSAKVSGVSLMKMKADKPNLNMVHWNHTGPESFLKTGIKYKAGHLRVDKDGMYYIFTQLTFAIKSNHAALPVNHKVHRTAATSEHHEVILEGRKSKCDLVEDSGNATSSLGALFELKEGDGVYVTTSKPEHLSPCHHGNFFGMYMVADYKSEVPTVINN